MSSFYFNDHPDRTKIEQEIHARPFPKIKWPGKLQYIAFTKSTDKAYQKLLPQLAAQISASEPEKISNHIVLTGSKYTLYWEDHTEFLSLLCCSENAENMGSDKDGLFPILSRIDLDALGLNRIKSLWINLIAAQDLVQNSVYNAFQKTSFATSTLGCGNITIATDFTEDQEGHSPLIVACHAKTGSDELGRVVKRLVEIEAYKTLVMRGYFLVQAQHKQIDKIEEALSLLLAQMKSGAANAEALLRDILILSVDIEQIQDQLLYRLRATEAYAELVEGRLKKLEEKTTGQTQSFQDILSRRITPAIRTTKSTGARVQSLVERISRASELLRTRVEVERAAQTQKLLASMDKRSKLQLRLQETVEGLSIVAISYYAVGLAAGMLSPISALGNISKTTLIAVITIPIVLIVFFALRHLRTKL